MAARHANTSSGNSDKTGPEPTHQWCCYCFSDIDLRRGPNQGRMCPAGWHFICRDCLQEQFRAAIRDSSLFPPRCCTKRPIPVDPAMLPPELAAEVLEKIEEWETPERTYCANPRCAAFVPTRDLPSPQRTVACRRCGTVTCRGCNKLAHASVCHLTTDPDEEVVHRLAQQNGWKRCPGCRSYVERADGWCVRMRCQCGVEFCYLCARKWKTCHCPHVLQPPPPLTAELMERARHRGLNLAQALRAGPIFPSGDIFPPLQAVAPAFEHQLDPRAAPFFPDQQTLDAEVSYSHQLPNVSQHLQHFRFQAPHRAQHARDIHAPQAQGSLLQGVPCPSKLSASKQPEAFHAPQVSQARQAPHGFPGLRPLQDAQLSQAPQTVQPPLRFQAPQAQGNLPPQGVPGPRRPQASQQPQPFHAPQTSQAPHGFPSLRPLQDAPPFQAPQSDQSSQDSRASRPRGGHHPKRRQRHSGSQASQRPQLFHAPQAFQALYPLLSLPPLQDALPFQAPQMVQFPRSLQSQQPQGVHHPEGLPGPGGFPASHQTRPLRAPQALQHPDGLLHRLQSLRLTQAPQTLQSPWGSQAPSVQDASRAQALPGPGNFSGSHRLQGPLNVQQEPQAFAGAVPNPALLPSRISNHRQGSLSAQQEPSNVQQGPQGFTGAVPDPARSGQPGQ